MPAMLEVAPKLGPGVQEVLCKALQSLAQETAGSQQGAAVSKLNQQLLQHVARWGSA
jgi:hypothetical protein